MRYLEDDKTCWWLIHLVWCARFIILTLAWTAALSPRVYSMQEDSSRSPTYTVPCEDYVHVVEFSPFSSGTSASLLAYGGNQYVVVGACLFQVTDATTASTKVENQTLCLFLNSCCLSNHRRRTWRLREFNLTSFELSIMNYVWTLLPGAQSPGWTRYPWSGTGLCFQQLVIGWYFLFWCITMSQIF